MASKILVVDDDLDTITYLRTLLTQHGHQVVSAENGMQALKLAHSEAPDLIILDVMMPNMDGYEVARSLRRHPETALIPILMFTAKTQTEDKVAGYQAGVDIYLTKPVHPVELQANIKALLLQRKSVSDETVKRGYTVGIIAAKGGFGVSTIALNLAVAYAQKTQAQVIAAELRSGQGTWAEELGLNDASGLTRLLHCDATDLTPSRIEEQLVQTQYGVRLLLASDISSDFDAMLATAQFESILEQLPLIASLVILDIGTNFIPSFNFVMEVCQEMIVVTEPQPISVKRTRVLVDELRAKGFGSSKVLNVVILNRTRADMSLSLSQVEEMLGQSVTLGIPPAAEQAYYAAVNARPLLTVQPEGLVAQQIQLLANQISHRVSK
jgi:DNA-binding response OmpR family regulator